MPPSRIRAAELVGRFTREWAFVTSFWNLHREQPCVWAGKRHEGQHERCALYVLRWGK
jgi:hypothetical protein